MSRILVPTYGTPPTGGGLSGRGYGVIPREVQTLKMARLSTECPRVPWDVFLRDYFKWVSGEHVALIGPTGLGKTTMELNLLPLMPFRVVFATKPRDKTMTHLIEDEGYLKMDRWQSVDAKQFPHRVLWPDASHMSSKVVQKSVFHDAFERIYREGGWCVALDETWYIDEELKLGGDIKIYLLQARSLYISLLCATQRPAWVPREIYNQSTHLFFWRTNDENDLKSLSGIGYRSAHLIRDAVSDLDEFQCLYVNTRTGKMVRTHCPAID